MNDLATSALEFWRFLWPAVIRVAIVISILFYLAPRLPEILGTELRRIRMRRILRFLRSKTAETLGLPKLVPVAVVFLLLLFMVITADIAGFVGSAMPPVLIWSSPGQYLAYGDLPGLLQVWNHLPERAELSAVPHFIDTKWKEESQDSGYAFWARRAHRAAVVSDHLKFFLVLALCSVALGKRLGPVPGISLRKRLLRVVLVLTLCFAASTAYAIHCHQELVEGKVRTAARWVEQNPAPHVPPAQLVEHRKAELEAERDRNQRTWHLGLPSWTW